MFVAVTTILALHVGVIGRHVPCHYDYDFMFPRWSCHGRVLARKGLPGGLAPGAGGLGWPPPPPREAGGFGRRHAPQWGHPNFGILGPGVDGQY